MGAASSKWKHLTPAQQAAFTAFGPDTVERMQEQFCDEAGPVDTHVQDVFTVMVRNSSSVRRSELAGFPTSVLTTSDLPATLAPQRADMHAAQSNKLCACTVCFA